MFCTRFTGQLLPRQSPGHDGKVAQRVNCDYSILLRGSSQGHTQAAMPSQSS